MTTLTPRPPLVSVVADVARAFGLSPRQLTGPSRAEHIVGARHAAMLLLRQGYGLSLAATGALLGGRDHTTVMHGVQAAATRCRHDAAYAARVAALSPQENTMADNALTTAARACVESLRRRVTTLRRGGHDGLALELELEAARLEAPLLVAETERRRRAEEALAARLHTNE